MKRTTRMLLAGALLLPGLSQAGNLGYSYLEAGYGETDLDDVDADGDGYRIAGSLAIGPAYHIIAEYTTANLDIDGTNIDADVDTISVGFGYNFPISPKADVIGRILYVDSEVKIDSPLISGEGDDSGIGLQARLRGELIERLEVEGGIDYVEVFNDETSFVLEGRYFLTDMLALGAGLEIGDDSTTYGVTLRFNFGAGAAR